MKSGLELHCPDGHGELLLMPSQMVWACHTCGLGVTELEIVEKTDYESGLMAVQRAINDRKIGRPGQVVNGGYMWVASKEAE